MADATRSHEVETKQTLAPTLEDGTLGTADDGEPNPPTGAASSITISSEQFDRVMSAYPHPSGCRQSSVCPAGTFRTRMKSAPLSVSEKSLLDIRYFGGRATTSMLIL